jgi:hypothetical protein
LTQMVLFYDHTVTVNTIVRDNIMAGYQHIVVPRHHDIT